MILAAYNDLCARLPHTFHVVQWGGAHVWKVGGAKGKVFAIAWDEGEKGVHVTFKCSQMSFDLLEGPAGHAACALSRLARHAVAATDRFTQHG
jgi:predicted DNA-binding protein (MmcQ/YjbR family)